MAVTINTVVTINTAVTINIDYLLYKLEPIVFTVQTECVPTDERTESLYAVHINDSLQNPSISKKSCRI